VRELLTESLVFTALVALAFMPLEYLVPAREARAQGRATDLGFATVGLVATRLLLLVVVGSSLSELDRFAPDASPFHAAGPELGAALDVALGLLVFELVGYAYHRLAHSVPWLFRLHAVHHSSESMDWLASFRQHPVEIVLMTLAQNAPLVLLGIPLGSHAIVLVLLRLNTVFVHSNIHLPIGPRSPWRFVVATPRFHHRHHQRMDATGEPTNFASLLPVLDVAFGTFDEGESTDFGLEAPMPTSFLGLVLHPFRRAAPGPRPTSAQGRSRPSLHRSTPLDSPRDTGRSY
jgi:sterol desaturase/sphingolipid hydroxylase (fatty acid hydroxylase superfamily)